VKISLVQLVEITKVRFVYLLGSGQCISVYESEDVVKEEELDGTVICPRTCFERLCDQILGTTTQAEKTSTQ